MKNIVKNQMGLPDEMEYPRIWPYNKKWEQSNIGQTLGWSRVDEECGVSGAGSKVRDYLTCSGVKALEKVVIQNSIIKKLKSGVIQAAKLSSRDVDWQSGNTWARLCDETELVFNVYGIEQASEEIREHVYFMKNFIELGVAHSVAIIEFIEYSKQEEHRLREESNCQKEIAKKTSIEDQRKKSATQKSLWDNIDVKHSKVEEGFIYILRNDLMPGVYKIGFTASNPDRRAEEITIQYNLPSPFKVEMYWRSKDPYIVEQRIHNTLKEFRKAGEFFESTLDTIKNGILEHLISVEN